MGACCLMAILALPDGRWRVDVEPIKGQALPQNLQDQGRSPAVRSDLPIKANQKPNMVTETDGPSSPI